MTLVEDAPRAGPRGGLAALRRPTDARLATAALTALAALTAVHAAVVAPHYHALSFDDDGHYLAIARAFLHGQGYVDTSLPGAPTETLYPPGYPALLVPLLWLFGGAMWPLRALSAVAMTACVPLTDLLLRRHRVPALPRLFALALFALSPVAATFATMLMPEAFFLLTLLGVLLALPVWERQGRLLTRAGAVVAIGAPFLLLLKSAGLPMLAGVIGWLALRRQWRRAGAVVTASAVLVGPVAVARLTAGNVVGDRYAHEYGHNGLLTGVGHGLSHYVTDAIPNSILQWFSVNLQHHGPVVDGSITTFRYTAALLVAVGWYTWLRTRTDATAVIVPLYLAETVPFPYINERRVVLLLPLVLAWYALGWSTLGAALRRRWPWRPGAAVAGFAVVPALVLVPVAMQFPRNYLLPAGEQMSAPMGSGYAAALRATTPPDWSIGTSYRWTMAAVTGRTARNEAFLRMPCPATPDPGFPARAHAALRAEHVATVLVGALNRPWRVDSPCMFAALTNAPWAVQVYDGADRTSVFVLLGPGTARPGAAPVVSAAAPAPTTVLAAPVSVTEVSVEAAATQRADVRLQLRRPDGTWVTVAAGRTRVHGVLLHARFARSVAADAVRVVAPSRVHLRHLVVLRGH